VIVAFDLSLTGTAVCADGRTDVFPTNGLTGHQRLSRILTHVLDWTDVTDLEFVAIEGYSYSSRATQAHKAGELGGLVRHHLWRRHIPYLDVPPSCVKKYATGKGNADKDAVIHAAIRRGGHLYTGTTNDEADAFWIWALACDLAGQPAVDVPQTHRAALDKLELPARAAA
jgi:Holliday junction resolvasome RuvABC endonuclease subunit